MVGYNLRYLRMIASMSQFENISGKKMVVQTEQTPQYQKHKSF